MQDAISLTRSLLRFDTVNPPGQERDCARHIGALLQTWGFRVAYHEFEEARTSVIAHAGGSESKQPLCLTGHIDTVPLGARAWSRDPFAGETDGDRLYGRGSSDMKAGVAAILLAARNLAKKLPGTPGVVLVLTAAEEGGCVGSQHLARTQLLGKAGAMVVGEPTSNYPLVGHKGSLKFHAKFRGVWAHGSMPELGVNAIYKAAKAVSRLEGFDFGVKPHPVMGVPTMNVGTFEGGQGVNMVPDEASLGVDIRTVAGMDHRALLARLRGLLGKEAELDVFSDMNAVWTEPEAKWIQRVFDICAGHLGARPTSNTATYNTDAGNLRQVYSRVPAAVSHTINGSLHATLPYDPIRDFSGVAHIGTVEYVLMINPRIPAKTVGEFVAYAKANPGKLNYATAGSGTATHLSMAYFAALAGIEMVHIPYKGTNEAVNEVLAGRADGVIAANIGALAFVKDARIRMLAVTSAKRSKFLPDLPTIADSGVPGYEFDSWLGLLGPAGMPAATVDQLNLAVASLLTDSVILQRPAKQGIQPQALSPQAFDALLRADFDQIDR